MFRNHFIALALSTTFCTSTSAQPVDLKEAIFAASIAYQKNTPLSDAQKEEHRRAVSLCEAISDEKSCDALHASYCRWALEKCQLDEERFGLAIKLDNVINLGRGLTGMGVVALAATVAFGVAGLGMGVAFILVGRYLVQDGPAMKARFDANLQSKRRSLNRPSSP